MSLWSLDQLVLVSTQFPLCFFQLFVPVMSPVTRRLASPKGMSNSPLLPGHCEPHHAQNLWWLPYSTSPCCSSSWCLQESTLHVNRRCRPRSMRCQVEKSSYIATESTPPGVEQLFFLLFLCCIISTYNNSSFFTIRRLDCGNCFHRQTLHLLTSSKDLLESSSTGSSASAVKLLTSSANTGIQASRSLLTSSIPIVFVWRTC